MQEYMRVCPKCVNESINKPNHSKIHVIGWRDSFKDENFANVNCHHHPDQPLIKVAMTCAEFQILRYISNDPTFMANMSNLKMSNPSEYERLLESYRPQAEQNKVEYDKEKERIDKFLDKRSNVRNYDREVRCPKCGSKSVTAGQRGYSIISGFLESGKTVNRCSACGYSWKPRG